MSILLNAKSRILGLIETNAPDPAVMARHPFFASNLVGHVPLGAPSARNLFPWLTEGVPVFRSVEEAALTTRSNVALVIASPKIAVAAALGAIAAGIPLIVIASEALTVEQTERIRAAARNGKCLILGPHQPEIVTPGGCQSGALPGYIFSRGQVGVLSECSALVSEVVLQTTAVGLGQSSVVSTHGSAIDPDGFAACLEGFLADERTAALALVLNAQSRGWRDVVSRLQKTRAVKPIVAHVALPYTSAVAEDSDQVVEPFAPHLAAVQEEALRASGVHVVQSSANIGWTVKSTLNSYRARKRNNSGVSDFALAMRQVEEEIYGTH